MAGWWLSTDVVRDGSGRMYLAGTLEELARYALVACRLRLPECIPLPSQDALKQFHRIMPCSLDRLSFFRPWQNGHWITLRSPSLRGMSRITSSCSRYNMSSLCLILVVYYSCPPRDRRKPIHKN